jgi:hypothetical protein
MYGKLSDAPVFTMSAGLNALARRARARRLHRQHGELGLIGGLLAADVGRGQRKISHRNPETAFA